MAITYTDNGGGAPNGSDLEFTYTFPVIQTEDVKVALNGVTQATTKYAVDNVSNPTKITFNNTSIDSSVQATSGAPKSGVLVRVYRETTVGKANGDEDPKAVFAAGSSIRAVDLNANQEQALFAIHELQNQPVLAEQIDTGAITSDKILDGTIVNADINSSAAIEGSKLQAASGSNAGSMSSSDKSKLDGIEAGATADQTNAEIKTAYEANSNTNAYTDTEKTFVNAITSTATELNYVDGVTSSIQTQIDGKQPLDSELTTLAGMQSGTASKLADSTALTSDIADLNQLDGLTKQTTISDTDASFPTSGAVVDYVTGQIDEIGGFEAIANELSFPNTQPGAGVAISIADAAGIVVNSSGVSTTGRTVGGSTVTINGINSQFNSSTVATGIRFIVTSTGSGQVYNYHKATLAESDLVNLSGDINDFNERYRVGSSNPTSSLDNGDLFFNTSTGKMLVYNGTNTAWEEVQSIGNFFISTLSPAFDGTTTDFTITNAPSNVQQILLVINGVVQKPNAGTSTPSEGFALDGSTIKLGAAPATGSTYHAVVIGSTVNIGTPSNNSVNSDILQNLSVSTGKIQDQAVTLDKLPHGTSSNDGKFLRANNGADPTFETVSTTPADGSITTVKLEDSSSATTGVTTAKIAEDAVTPAKLSIMTESNNAGTAGKLRLNDENNGTTYQRANKNMHQIRDDVYVQSTVNVGDKAGFDFTPLTLNSSSSIVFDSSNSRLTLTTTNAHSIGVGTNVLLKNSANDYQISYNTSSGTSTSSGTTIVIDETNNANGSVTQSVANSLAVATTTVTVHTPADPRGCINVAKDHDKFDQNTFNPILRGYVGKDLDTQAGANTEFFKLEVKKDSSATDHVATLLHSTRDFGAGQRLALTIDDGNSYPDGKNLVLTQNGVKITADDSAFTDSDELLEVEGNAKIDGNLEVTGTLSAGGDGTISGDELFLTDSIKHVGDTDTSISFPSNDTIRLGTGGTTRLEIDSNGKSTFSGDVQIDADELFIADSIKHVGDTDTIISFPAANTIRFHTGGTQRLDISDNGNIVIADGNLQVANGHGIDFSDTGDASGAAVELLDDYEEGTFTLSVTQGGGSIAGTGQYTKVGRLVAWNIDASISGTRNGDAYILDGLPYNCGGNWSSASGYAQSYSGSKFTPVVRANNTEIYIQRFGDNMPGDNLGNGYLNLGGTYSTS